MSVKSVTVVTMLALAFIAMATIPTATGLHCTSKIAVYGRTSLSPQPPPPYSTTTSGPCLVAAEGTPLDGTTLPPGINQVFVRINGDFGPSIQKVRVELTGLGFDHSSIQLNRTSSSINGHSYDMREWTFIPQPGVGGEINVTAFYPSATHTMKFRVAQLPVTP